MLTWLRKLLGNPRPESAVRGARGEACAAEFLRRERGFKIVAQNWRLARDRRIEIDLVGRDGDILVFVEVKTRDPDALVPGYFAVNARKKRILKRACMAYLAQLGRRPRIFRFDVVEVMLPPGPPGGGPIEVRHFENIPLFPKHYTG